MKEKIIEINEFECKNMSGYKIITTDQIIEFCIDNDQQCCENWGYLWSNENPSEFIGADILDILIVDTALNTTKLKNIYGDDPYKDEDFLSSTIFININTSCGILEFIAYNNHNGYYGHMVKIKCSQLNHEEVL